MNHFPKKMQSEFQMAIAPIDLQTLYSQLDKVGKTYGNQAQALQMQNAITDVEKAKQQLEEQKKIASTAMPEEEDTQRVKDRQYRNPQNSEKKQNSESEEEIDEEKEQKPKRSIFQDPNLGQHIDVIG